MSNILLYHFTHIANLPGIIQNGLLADNFIAPINYINSGSQEIKNNRKKKIITSGRYVGDYVPFYFAPCSPMMYRQKRNGLIDNNSIIYLVADAIHLTNRYEWCCSDTNAAKFNANFFNTWEDMLRNIDWDVMNLTYWQNTPDDPNRKDRRMAEFLAYKAINFIDFCEIATYNDAITNAIIAQYGSCIPYIETRSDWYF